MKLVTFEGVEGVEIGVLGGDSEIVRLLVGERMVKGKGSGYFNDMLAFLRGGVAAREVAAEVVAGVTKGGVAEAVVSLGEVTLLAPVPRPESIRDCMSFEQHIINSIRMVGLGKLGALDEMVERVLGRKWTIAYRANKAWYERPLYYKSNRFSVVGTGAEVRIPAGCEQFDYELEWGVFIGKEGRDIPVEKAHEYIGGYTIFNDFSARDMQMKEIKGRLGPAKGKDFDTGNVMGPWLVTPDEVAEPYNLRMTATVNGEEWSRGTTADMGWKFEEMIAYMSRDETLYPGEFIGSGTCSGAVGKGCGLEMGKFLSRGDEVVLRVEGMGELVNRVV
ncbi:MAG TPA: fumarylacetoacetate hydrolase family protein [Anaerolineae bacterium]|nr:fumarylacetoacetate hydrolase family protein [Anaerolineae bacterium]